MMKAVPFEVVDKLPALEKEFLTLIKGLTESEWQAQTIAQLWKVKDAVAHLLDGNIRILSMLRNGYFGESTNANSYQELVAFLNQLNADWVKAMKRVSPSILILLHELKFGAKRNLQKRANVLYPSQLSRILQPKDK